jgi:hypothetical protein
VAEGGKPLTLAPESYIGVLQEKAKDAPKEIIVDLKCIVRKGPPPIKTLRIKYPGPNSDEKVLHVVATGKIAEQLRTLLPKHPQVNLLGAISDVTVTATKVTVIPEDSDNPAEKDSDKPGEKGPAKKKNPSK